MVRDPVCDREIDPEDAVATTNYEGDTYYFCSEDCKRRFDADPERYVSRREASAT
jgi:Cu+-exporting ATPase